MSVIKKWLKRLEEDRKKQILFFCCTMIIIILGYSNIHCKINQRFNIVEDDYSWNYQIDTICQEQGNLILSGWAFKLDCAAVQEGFDLILYDAQKKKAYFPKMEYIKREDVNKYFLCEFDYSYSGFIASISLRQLDLENDVYEILLRPKGTQKSFATGIFYYNGNMVFVSPENFELLEVSGLDLEPVVQDGVLRVYRPDYGMYVYQYNDELYWIADDKYDFEDGNTYIRCQLNTTQVEKLPKERLEQGTPWGNIGFDFVSNEVSEWNTGKYRVAKCALPREYSITKIWTGNYIEDWVWIQYFRPWYEFN